MSAKTVLPAIEGWFTLDPDEPALLGTRCTACDTRFFPKETLRCRNPACGGRELEEVALSRTGTLWSFTENHFAPPPPYVAAEPFEPYVIGAVELAEEQMVVLGQMVPGTDLASLAAGTPVELVLDTLYEDDEHTYLVWKWQVTR